MNPKFILFLIFLPMYLVGQNKVDIANEYYQQGEMDKAYAIYKELAKYPKNFLDISRNYLAILKANNNFKQTEQFLGQAIKTYPNDLYFKSKRAALYHHQGEEKKLALYLKELQLNLNDNFFKIRNLAELLTSEMMYKEAISTYLLIKKKGGSVDMYSLDLALVYRYVGDKLAMLEEYLNYAVMSERHYQYVRNLLQSYLQLSENWEELKASIVQKMQDLPNNRFLAELLIWVELQQKNFNAAFIQARALDRRNKTFGDRSMGIGKIALKNNAFDEAIKIFDYISTYYQHTRNYSRALRYKIEAKEKKLKSTSPIRNENIRALIQEYQQLYDELSPSEDAFEVLRNMALLHGFYLGEIDTAKKLMSVLVNDKEVKSLLKAKCKLDLGDFYLLHDEPWESLLLYLQVEKSYKNHVLGHEAKLRRARLNYYTGNFVLAKSHLDILKRNTTKEISNDALALGMLITDNTAFDSTDTVMEQFAAVELLIFQNKKLKAKERLAVMLKEYEYHLIADEIYWLLAKLELEDNNLDSAVVYLDKILSYFMYDILADDAAFLKAEIFELHFQDVNQAMEFYKQFLKDYPGSMYVAEARKRFRKLRGDDIN